MNLTISLARSTTHQNIKLQYSFTYYKKLFILNKSQQNIIQMLTIVCLVVAARRESWCAHEQVQRELQLQWQLILDQLMRR